MLTVFCWRLNGANANDSDRQTGWSDGDDGGFEH